ncbi:MAG: endonuclease/exonuclease/phosphatase family protein [Alkalibacterium sp.]|nr:endonuclease/exonuclease/phosphatase family protein [Alkalibacterium sp.]
MKVLTLNTHSWVEEHPEEKLEQLADELAKQKYDIIALQEVNQSIGGGAVETDTFIPPKEERFPVPITEDNFAHQLVQKLKNRGVTYYWSWAAVHISFSQYDEGIAILSKEPFTAESYLVSDTQVYSNYYTRKVLNAHIELDGIASNVFSVHFSWWKDAEGSYLFKGDWERTLEKLNPSADAHLLIMGDFNNDSSVREEGYDLVRKTAPFLKDAYEVAETKTGEATITHEIDGWEGHFDEKRIDYIFVGEQISVKQHRVVFDGKSEPVISDHFGVEAHLNIKTY